MTTTKLLLLFALVLPLNSAAALDPLLDAIDRREVDSPALSSAVLSKKPKRRALAAVGYGRIMNAKGIDPLIKLSRDALPFVREASAFALGQLGWLPEATGSRLADVQAALSALLTDKQLSVRLAATEALGKTGLEKTPDLIAPSLASNEAPLRAAAVMAIFRSRMILKLRNPASPPGEVAEPLRERLIELSKDQKNGKVRLAVAYFFARNSEPKAEPAVAALAGDKNETVKMFALNGLSKMKAKSSGNTLLAGARDPSYSVRLAALAALISAEENLLGVTFLANDKSFHVRAAYAAGLKISTPAEAEVLSQLMLDQSPTVRAEALKAIAKGKGDSLLPWLKEEMTNADWQVREAAVQASEPLKPEEREVFLQTAFSDTNVNVKAAALEALSTIPSELAFRQIKASLESPELAVRGTAVAALKDRKEEERVALGWKTYNASPGDRWTEVREELVDLFAKNSSEMTTSYLRQILLDKAYGVRAKARKALEERGATDLPSAPEPELSFSPHRELAFRRHPFVEIETNKGRFVVECFSDSAPIHVADFVGNVKTGYYDGLTWHRVVSNFVVQGGDPDGSGWGGGGYALRAEVNQQPFLRGALGMPRSQGFDTGGSQLFFSHIPTPHLEGQYTVFGQAVRGLDVIDRLERGDLILRARLIHAK